MSVVCLHFCLLLADLLHPDVVWLHVLVDSGLSLSLPLILFPVPLSHLLLSDSLFLFLFCLPLQSDLFTLLVVFFLFLPELFALFLCKLDLFLFLFLIFVDGFLSYLDCVCLSVGVVHSVVDELLKVRLWLVCVAASWVLVRICVTLVINRTHNLL